MSRKDLVAPNVRNPDISNFAFTDAEKALADSLGIDIGASIDSRLQIAVGKTNQALRLVVEAGVLFLSIKAEVRHGEFIPRLEEVGVNPQRAHECMVFAKSAALLDVKQRAMLLSLPKTKALYLANAEPEVLDALMSEEGYKEISELSARGLLQRIRELEAKTADAVAERDTAKAEAAGLKKQLKGRDADSDMPAAVADLRQEVAALVKQADLALDGLAPIGPELMNWIGTEHASAWVEPTGHLTMAGLISLRARIDGLLQQFAQTFEGVARPDSSPPALAYLAPQEIAAVAEQWATLTATHQHEAALRQHEREAARPKGRGRPKAAPKA